MTNKDLNNHKPKEGKKLFKSVTVNGQTVLINKKGFTINLPNIEFTPDKVTFRGKPIVK